MLTVYAVCTAPIYLYVRTYVCTYISHIVDAPPIDSITVVEACRNDFTVSWTATSNEIRLSYNVTLSPPSSVALITTMDNSYNFTGLMPNTTYAVTIRAGEVVQCLGAPTTMMIATPTSGPVVRNSEFSVYV